MLTARADGKTTLEQLTQQEIQDELFDLLCIFDDHAKKLGLRYSLEAGSLLGAARHQGFIPWDNDIDVMMPRPDFERLIEEVSQIPSGYTLNGFDTDGAPFPFLKFANLSIRMQEDITGGVHDQYLWIDIFPIDGMHDDEEKNLAVYNDIRKLMNKRIFQLYPSPNKYANIIKKPIQAVINLVRPLPKVMAEMNTLAQQVPFGESVWCKDVVWANSATARFKTTDFNDMQTLPFCGREFPVINNWNDYLKTKFGDYMKLPPKEEQVGHLVKTWRV